MRYLLILTAIALLAGCDRAVIDGKVFDARGEALPGVSVMAAGTPYESLTNGRGEYALRFVPSKEFHVKFFKTGYTTGDLRIQNVTAARSVTANPINLISLPEGPGVYLSDAKFTDYIRTAADTPTSFQRASDKSAVFGTHRQPIETMVRTPFIVIYRGFTIPRYGIKMNRLEEIDVMPPPGVSGKTGGKAWVRSGDVPIDVREVDVGQGQLLSITFANELDYGAYAVHWGSLDGDLNAEEHRMFCFKVAEQPTPTADLAKPAPDGTGPGAADKKSAPPKTLPPVSEAAPDTPDEREL